MALGDYLQFENPVVVAIAISFLIFIAVIEGLKQIIKDTPIRLLIGLILASITAYGLYKKTLNVSGNILAATVVILIVAILIFIAVPFFRNMKRSVRY